MRVYQSILFLFSVVFLSAQDVDFEWAVSPSFYKVGGFSCGLAKVFEYGGRTGYIDTTGSLLIPMDFVFGTSVNEDRIFLRKGHFNSQKFEFYNNKYEKILSDTFDYATEFSEGLSIVKKGDKVYALNKNGEKVFSIGKDLRWAHFEHYSNGVSVFYIGELGSEYWGTLSNMGILVVEPKYKYISNFNNGVAAFQSGSYWGVIDKQGQVVLAPKYDWINGFSEGLAVVRQGKYHGYIDASGKKVISIMYKQAHSFSEGVAAVENDSGLWGFIDKNNQYVIRPQFAQAFSFYEGLARVENDAEKIGYINKEGKVILGYQFEDGRDLSEGMIAVKEGGKWGYIRLLDPPKIEIKQEVEIVEQPIADEKKLKLGKGILVSSGEIQLEIFDFEKEDGDSISLSFNEKFILENYLLKNTPIILKINLESNQDNKLVLYAHNLGQKPPNTAAIRITDSQGKVQQVEMISDLANSDVLYFFRKQQDVSGQIDFTISYFDVDEKFKELVEKIPKQEVIKFKGSRLRKNLENSFFIYDNSLKNSYLCKDEPSGKVAYYGPLNQKVELELVDEKYNVLDYVCRKAIVTIRGEQTEVYYTTELPFAYSPFEGIPGVVLQYSKKTPLGMKTVTANKVAFLEMSDELFSIEEYELQSKSEKQKQMMKEMRAKIDARKKGVDDAKKKLLNKPAPPIVFSFLDDTTKPLSEYSSKVVVLNFWFVECMPCKIEIPTLNAVVDSFKNKDVVFISIARNKADVVKAFLEKNEFNYLPSIGDKHFDLYGVKTFPSTVIINKVGEVIYFSSGLKKDIDKELIDVIHGALK